MDQAYSAAPGAHTGLSVCHTSASIMFLDVRYIETPSAVDCKCLISCHSLVVSDGVWKEISCTMKTLSQQVNVIHFELFANFDFSCVLLI